GRRAGPGGCRRLLGLPRGRARRPGAPARALCSPYAFSGRGGTAEARRPEGDLLGEARAGRPVFSAEDPARLGGLPCAPVGTPLRPDALPRLDGAFFPVTG